MLLLFWVRFFDDSAKHEYKVCNYEEEVKIWNLKLDDLFVTPCNPVCMFSAVGLEQ